MNFSDSIKKKKENVANFLKNDFPNNSPSDNFSLTTDPAKIEKDYSLHKMAIFNAIYGGSPNFSSFLNNKNLILKCDSESKIEKSKNQNGLRKFRSMIFEKNNEESGKKGEKAIIDLNKLKKTLD